MQHKSFSFLPVFVVIATFGCSSPSPNVETGTVAAKSTVVSEPVPPETLQALQNSVFLLEDKIYGLRKLGTLGLYGELKNCHRKLASRQYGGSGDLVWGESMDRLTERENEFKGKNSDVRNEQTRFNGYRRILQRRFDEFSASVSTCNTELAKRELDSNQSSRVVVTEAPKGAMNKEAVNQFLCQFVKKNASLRDLMFELFARGWLALGDFGVEQNLIANSLKDSKGSSRDNGLLFNGWKFSFDQGQVTVVELLEGNKDAKLEAWASGESCLGSPGVRSPGVWNL